MNYLNFVYAGISFLVALLSIPWLIRYLRKIDLVVKDQNKKDTPLVPISGGLSVCAGLIAGLMSFIFIRIFFPSQVQGFDLNNNSLMFLFAATTTILIITLIGFVDDLIINRTKDSSSGLRQWQKPLLTLAAAIPLMVVNVGDTTMLIPFFGVVNVGIIYPIIFIPIGVVGASNMVNILAGFNGMETGMGLIYTGMLGLYAYVNESYIAAILALVTFFALLAFYYYNKYPAKILPGDSLTYLLGAVLACIAILGNIEKAALICSIPFFIEFILKLRSRLKARTYGYYKDGKIASYYNKVYSLPHLFTRTGKFTEKQIVYFMILIQLFFSSLIWFI